MKFNHLTIEEREKIQELLWQNKSIRHIARELNRSPSSISREIKRNGTPKDRRISKRYIPRLANERALGKRKSRGREDRLKNTEIRDYVINKLRLRWSPEQISGRMPIDLKINISHEAIYQFIYHQIHRDGYGYSKPNKVDLRTYLRRRHKRRQKKGLRKSHKVPNFSGVSIEKRLKIVDRRKRVGDWESDTVESMNHKPGVNTLLERKSGLYFVTKLKNKTSKSTKDSIIERLRNFPVHTITFDNGSENAGWLELEKELNIKTYFCHPYCSGERGSNENTNGLLRDFFPKSTDFTKISQEKLNQVERLLNTRPRKRLNWKTPLEVFSASVAIES